LPSSLETKERLKAIVLIRRYAHNFSKSATELGRNNLQPHRIDTGDHPLIKQAMRRQPYAYIEEIERNVQELLATDIIDTAVSTGASNVLIVKKRTEHGVFVSTTES
jgi:hypothetical protein